MTELPNVTCRTFKHGCLAMAVIFAASATPALAQSRNPFVPPSGGLSKKQIEDIVRAEVARNGGGQSIAPSPQGPQPNAPQGGVAGQLRNGTGSAVAAIPTQGGGQPNASTASDGRGGPVGATGPGGAPTALASVDDPVAKVVADGGGFVGCVGSTPVFKDKDGRRAYFTSKELKLSNVARRYARCGG